MDIIIIGCGPGGQRAAEYAAKRGLHVTICEKAELGGTCLNEGCIPTKTLARHAEVAETLRRAHDFGFAVAEPTLDYGLVRQRKDAIVAQLRSGIESVLASYPTITLLRREMSVGEALTMAPHVIIATGSETKLLPIDGIGQAMTSRELLDIDHVPPRLAIIGAGVIGMEFASIFSSLGSQVTVVEYLKECLPALDSDIAKRLRKTLEKRGVAFHMQAACKQVRKAADGAGGAAYEVVFEQKGKEVCIEADEVLSATGRKPRLSAALGLEAAGISYDEKTGIHVDDNMQTSAPGVYAIGDVNGRQMLAHAASAQAVVAVNHILGLPATPASQQAIPAAIFTHPEAACVGLSEDQCKELGRPYQASKHFFRANGKAVAMGDTEGMVKLLADETGRIVGCHAFGPHSADIVQEVSVLMCKDTTVDELRQMVHIHPTLGEVLVS